MNQPNPNHHFDHAAAADALKCPVCRKHATSKRIFQCSSGHIFCQSCHEEHQFTQCPSTCRRPIREPPIRNLAMEKARDFILFPCTFSDVGCRRLFRPAEKAVHEADQCMFRSVTCFLGECPWFRPLHELPDHLQEAHGKVCVKPSGKFDVTVDSQTELAAETEAAVLFLLSDGQKKCMLFVGKLDPSPQSQQAKIYAFGLIGLGGGGGNHQQEEEEAAGNVSFSYKLTLGNSTTALTKTYEGSPLSLNLLPQLNITAETRGVHFCDEATFQQLLVNGSLLHIKVSLITVITLD
ncbi:E3 ubiquitin-protein ligase Siah1 [Tyrophagus putrescentiae]|nr:E3 ubiquitin-protein ligase Siah1 [Tyrophagus putrescentiae]